MILETDRALVEALARHLCKRDGYKPDAHVTAGDGQDPLRGPRGSIVAMNTFEAWRLYASDAHAAIEWCRKHLDPCTVLPDNHVSKFRPEWWNERRKRDYYVGDDGRVYLRVDSPTAMKAFGA